MASQDTGKAGRTQAIGFSRHASLADAEYAVRLFHDTAPVRAADPRPRSAVSTGCGFAGLAGLLIWVAVARAYRLDGPYAALVDIAACGLPMVLWSVFVDKVHRNPSTGIDWSAGRPLRETWEISLTKLAGYGSPGRRPAWSTASSAAIGRATTPLR